MLFVKVEQDVLLGVIWLDKGRCGPAAAAVHRLQRERDEQRLWREMKALSLNSMKSVNDDVPQRLLLPWSNRDGPAWSRAASASQTDRRTVCSRSSFIWSHRFETLHNINIFFWKNISTSATVMFVEVSHVAAVHCDGVVSSVQLLHTDRPHDVGVSWPRDPARHHDHHVTCFEEPSRLTWWTGEKRGEERSTVTHQWVDNIRWTLETGTRRHTHTHIPMFMPKLTLLSTSSAQTGAGRGWKRAGNTPLSSWDWRATWRKRSLIYFWIKDTGEPAEFTRQFNERCEL